MRKYFKRKKLIKKFLNDISAAFGNKKQTKLNNSKSILEDVINSNSILYL